MEIIQSVFIYETAPFPQCHASTLLETKDGLLAAWFGGTYERHPDISIYISFYKNGEWGIPFLVADGVEHEILRNPLWNPVLFRRDNGDIILYYKGGPSPAKWYGVYKISTDEGLSWSKEHRIPNNLLGPIKNKPVKASDGGILYPTSIEDDQGWRIHIEHSNQDLSDWKKIEIDNGTFYAIQPSVLHYKDGSLQLLCRSQNERIVESWSRDGGKTWSKVQATSLPNNNSGTDAVTLSDGETQLLIYNPITRGRNKLAIAASYDGKVWKDLIILEDEPQGEFSYPAIIEGKDGTIHVTYTHQRRKIKHVQLKLTR